MYGKPKQIWHLTHNGAIPPLCRLLQETTDHDLLLLVLEGIERMLLVGKKVNSLDSVVEVLCVCDGITVIRRLQAFEEDNNKIMNRIDSILNIIFNDHLILLDQPDNQLTSIQYYRNILSFGKFIRSVLYHCKSSLISC